jgi:hypothetical protein
MYGADNRGGSDNAGGFRQTRLTFSHLDNFSCTRFFVSPTLSFTKGSAPFLTPESIALSDQYLSEKNLRGVEHERGFIV